MSTENNRYYIDTRTAKRIAARPVVTDEDNDIHMMALEFIEDREDETQAEDEAIDAEESALPHRFQSYTGSIGCRLCGKFDVDPIHSVAVLAGAR